MIIELGFEDSYSERVAELFDEAFASKFSLAIPSQKERLQFWQESINPEQVLAAYQDTILIGVALFATSKSSGFKRESGKILQKQLGTLGAIRAGAIFSLFTHRPKIGEMYIEAISVDGNSRGLGVGKLLLDKIAEKAKSESHTFMSLKVILENHRARKLYEREGFRVRKSKSSRIMKFVSGASGVHFMEKFVAN